MLSTVAQWLTEYETVFSALAAIVALAGVSYGFVRYASSPWLAKRSADRQADARPSPDASGSTETASAVSDSSPVQDVQDDHVSVAVLTFESLSSNEDDKYIAAGIASEIIALITPIADLRVSARSTLYGWEAKDVPARKAAEQINAKFALTGSLRIDDRRMRVIASLTKLKTDALVWSETYDKEIEDLFSVQYDIARAIVAAILGEVRLAESQLAVRMPEQQLDAWGLLQKAYYFWLTNFSVENVLKATVCLRKAIAIDDDYAAPKAALAMLLSQLTTSRVCEDRAAVVEEIAGLAERAHQMAPNDADVLESLGVAWQNIGEGTRALKAFRRAVELTPLNLICRGYLAMTLSFTGGVQGAKEARLLITENFRIAPHHPAGPWWYWFLALSEQVLGDYEASCQHCEKSLLGQQGWVHAYYFLANALCELGRVDEAAAQLAAAEKVNPAYNTALYVDNLKLICGSDELAAAFHAGLERAGFLDSDESDRVRISEAL